MLFFEENETETKDVVPFNEGFNGDTFLQEMAIGNYQEDNLKFAKALEEALNNDSLISLEEGDKELLESQIAILEERIQGLKDICSLEEGFGFISFLKQSYSGMDKKVIDKVENKMKEIKTQDQKDKIVKDLEKVKARAKTADFSNQKDFLTKVKSATKINFVAGNLGLLLSNHNSKKGSLSDFIKGIDSLIKDVKSIKVEE